MIQLSQQVISYFNRLQALDQTRSNSLARHAFAEQRTKKLTWYQNTIKILEIAGHHHTSNASPTHIKSKLQEHFNNLWEAERHKSSKLSYYNEVKRTPHIYTTKSSWIWFAQKTENALCGLDQVVTDLTAKQEDT